MKMFRVVRGETICYLQNYDADILSKFDSTPGSVLLEILNLRGDSHDEYRFAYRFEDPESVKYLESLDWILDFEQYRYIDLRTLDFKIAQEKSKCKERVAEFNSRSRVYREHNYAEVGEYIAKAKNIVLSLEILKDYVENKRQFAFPEEIFPEDFWKPVPKSPGLLRRIFHK